MRHNALATDGGEDTVAPSVGPELLEEESRQPSPSHDDDDGGDQEKSSSGPGAEDDDESEVEDDDGGSVGGDGEDTAKSISATRRALLAAVEGGGRGGGNREAGGRKSAAVSNASTPEKKRSGVGIRPVVTLFFYPGEGRSARQERDRALGLIRDRKCFHKGHARRLFAGLADILERVCEEEDYVPASAYMDDDEEGSSQQQHNRLSVQTTATVDIEPDEESTEALLFMKACALMVEAYIEGVLEKRKGRGSNVQRGRGKEFPVMEEVLTVAEHLHDTLFSLQTCGSEGLATQASISSLCETWWHGHFQYRELLVTQLLPLLLVKSLDVYAKVADVKRMFELRDALKLLDFEDGSIAYLRSLLLKTVSSPLFLKTTEGRRLVVCLFQLHDSLVSDLHKSMKVQMPNAKKAVLLSYGDIYLRAWKEAADDPDIRASIEENALQDLMYSVLHVSRPATFKAVRAVLSPLHEAKKTPEIDTLLYRMYGPIIWRALKSANPLVRENAASILADTFPLRDPSAGQVQTDACLERTVASLTGLLNDTIPRVRVAGADATSKVLVTFWDALPSEGIRSLLNDLVTKHASDASSCSVRASAVSSITLLLEAPHSHAVLRALLPSLGNLIHDKVERVRFAVVKMLLKIKKLKGIKFYHVVPVDHLLARLAAEGEGANNPTGPVASALTELLLNSYFPRGEHVTGSLQLQRTLSFLSSNPAAAAVFYRNMSTHLSVNSVAKLAAMLLKCLKASIDAEKSSGHGANRGGKRRRSRTNDKSQVEEEGSEASSGRGGLTASNTSLMASIAEAICCLWDSISLEVLEPHNDMCKDFLIDTFSGATISTIHAHFEEEAHRCSASTEDGLREKSDCHRICASLLRCAGRLPADSLDELSAKLTHRLSTVEEKSNQDSLTPHIALLCLWGKTEGVASCLAKSISSLVPDESGEKENHRTPMKASRRSRGNNQKRKSRKQDSAEETLSIPELPADVAVRVLGSILSGSNATSIAARNLLLSSESACSTIEGALESVTTAAETVLNTSELNDLFLRDYDVSLILTSCELYGRFALHKAAINAEPVELIPQANTLLSWITNAVVPALMQSAPTLSNLDLSKISSVGDSPLPPFSPLSSEPPRRRSNRNKTPIRFSSFSGAGSLDGYDHGVPTFIYGHAAAISLIKTATVLFSEWLLVAGSNGTEIMQHAVKWCQVLGNLSADVNVGAELLPGFCRLMTQLTKSTNDIGMLREILTVCDGMEEGSEEESLLTKSIVQLLSLRPTNVVKSPCELVVSAVFGIVREASKKYTGALTESTSTPFEDIHAALNTAGRAALAAVISSRTGSIALAKHLSKQLSDPVDSENDLLIDAHCFDFLCRETASRGSNGAEILRIARGTDIGWIEKDGFLGQLVAQFTEQTS